MVTMLHKVLDKLFTKPHFRIGDEDVSKPDYLHRWYLIPKNKFFNIYLHKFLRSDDDRALHDHPWASISFILSEGYYEHFPLHTGGQETYVLERKPFSPIIRGAEQAHRIELRSRVVLFEGDISELNDPSKTVPRYEEMPCWSLFITGPKVREWGFHCTGKWVHWEKFTKIINGVSVGGCQ